MPAFPHRFISTVSHWQATNRGPSSLWNHGRDDALPDTADDVIIGAGVTGAAMAYHLTRPGAAGEGKTIVVLEAKDVASCASGRNGGHIAPHSFRLFDPLTTPLEVGGAGLTDSDALDVYFFELDNLDYVQSVVEKEGIDADFWRGDRLEVVNTAEGVRVNSALHEQFKAALRASDKYLSRGDEWEVITDAEEAIKITRMPNTLQVNRGPGGSWHPHRGVTALLKLALGSKTSNCRLYSWTPVEDFTSKDGVWTVNCGERGTIRARNVFVATNAYTRHLFPQEQGEIGRHVIPYRGFVGLVTPPTTYAGSAALKTSYGVEAGPYLIHTPSSGLVLGPYTSALEGIVDDEEVYGIEDDSEVLPRMREWIANYCKDKFDGWGTEVVGEPGEGLARVWSGILAWSIDRVPLVGPVPDHPGLWVSMAYNGHGMATIMNITRHLSRMMKTGEWEGIPPCFQITKERLEKAKGAKPFL